MKGSLETFKLKKTFKIFVTIGAIPIALGLLIQSSQSIPDNALIFVFPTNRYWIPDASFAVDKLKRDMPGTNTIEDTERSLETVQMLAEITPATWIEVKSGEYGGFSLPPGWKTAFDTYRFGKDRSFYLSLIIGPNKRWNEDGSWNY